MRYLSEDDKRLELSDLSGGRKIIHYLYCVPETKALAADLLFSCHICNSLFFPGNIKCNNRRYIYTNKTCKKRVTERPFILLGEQQNVLNTPM